MIRVKHRFHGYGSLRSVYRHGRNLRGPMVSLKYSRRDPKKPYRTAVVASRKVSKSAVTRNRIRRRIYELVRRHEADIRPGTDLVFTAFDERLAEMEPDKLDKAIEELLHKAGQHR